MDVRSISRSAWIALAAAALTAIAALSPTVASAWCPAERRLGVKPIGGSPDERIFLRVNADPWLYDILGCPTSGFIRLPEPNRAPPGSPNPNAYVGGLMFFEHGSIYTGYHYTMPAYFVRGAIRDAWGRLGWEKGPLGYPTSDEAPAANGGAFNRFEGGAVYYHPATGAYNIYGDIYRAWAASGYEWNHGYPQSDEVDATWGCPAGTRAQAFTNGELACWFPATREVRWVRIR